MDSTGNLDSVVEFTKAITELFKGLFSNLTKNGSSGKLLVWQILFLITIITTLVLLGLLIAGTIKNYKKNSQLMQRFTAVMNSLQTEFPELGELAKECRLLGERIDSRTNRRQNSKKLSILAYDIAKALDVEPKTRFLYFCCAMVFDCGYLEIPGELFRVEVMSNRERQIVRTHVLRFEEYFDFIPAEYFPVFYQAAMLHRENYDGTGFPEGLRGEEIPLQARIIRLLESYVSLTSHRAYHKTLAHREAIAILRKQHGLYDKNLVDILEKTV